MLSDVESVDLFLFYGKKYKKSLVMPYDSIGLIQVRITLEGAVLNTIVRSQQFLEFRGEIETQSGSTADSWKSFWTVLNLKLHHDSKLHLKHLYCQD